MTDATGTSVELYTCPDCGRTWQSTAAERNAHRDWHTGHAIPNSAAERTPQQIAWDRGQRGGHRPPDAPTSPPIAPPKPMDATRNSVADYPEDARWRQTVETEIICLQEAVADLQRRMAT